MQNTKSKNSDAISISELLLERGKIIGDFMQALGDWLVEFNNVTDKMIESLRDSNEVESKDSPYGFYTKEEIEAMKRMP